MKYERATEIERAAGGVLDDELRRGKRFVRRVVLAVFLLGMGLVVLTIMLVETVKRTQ